MVKLLLNKWNGGITNDEYIGQQGGHYDIEAVDFRKNSVLARNKKQISKLGSDTLGYPSSFLLGTTGLSGNGITTTVESTYGGFVYPVNNVNLYGPLYKEKNGWGIYNVLDVRGTGYLIALGAIHAWTIDYTSTTLGILGTNMIFDYSFLDASKWTLGANWAVSGGQATHTAGSTATLSTTLASGNLSSYSAGKKYRIMLTCTYPKTGTLDVSLGGTTFTAIIGGTSQTPSSTNLGILTFFGITVNNTGNLIITPSNDFDGDILDIAVTEVKINENYYTYTNSGGVASTYRPAIEYFNSIYIPYGNELFKIDVGLTPTGALTSALTLAYNDGIRSVCKVGDQLIIRCNNGNNTVQYFWDFVATAPQRQITRFDLAIENVANLGDYQIAVCSQGTGQVKSLWKVQGYNKQLISKSKIGDDRLKFNSSYTNAIETYDNIVYCGGTQFIYGYGAYYPGFPEAVCKERAYKGGITTTIYAIDGPTFLIGCVNTTGIGTVYAIYDVLTNYGSNGNGFILTNPIYGPNYSDLKASLKYRVGYNLPSTAGMGAYNFRPNYIGIYTKLNDVSNIFTFYVDGQPLTAAPLVTQVYSNNGSQFTITAVFTVQSVIAANKYGYYIVTTRTSGVNDPILLVGGSILTKVSGTGDASRTYLRCRPYELINVISDETKRRQTYLYTKDFNKIQFGFELIETAQLENIYAELSDFVLIYNVIQNDI